MESGHSSDAKARWDEYYGSIEQIDPAAVSPFVAVALESFRAGAVRRVLDLGCGLGHDARYLAEGGLTVVALDFSQFCLRRLGALECVLADIARPLPFRDGAFEGVYSHLGLHYFDTPTTRAIFRELWRVLSPGGLLAFGCKSVEDPLYGQGRRIGPDMFERRGHCRHFFSLSFTRELLQGWDVLFLNQARGTYARIERESAFVQAIARKPGQAERDT